MSDQHEPVLARRQAPGRSFKRLPVTRLASGADLSLGLHVLTGRKEGPTLGILTTVHGDETMPVLAVRKLFESVNPDKLAGRLAAIPVANPLAVTAFSRQTPEQHGKTDLHEVFPGSPKGNVTQRLAHTITKHLLDHVDALVDIHSGGLGGRLQSRADLDASASPDIFERALKLCRAFGADFIHSNDLAGTAARYCNGRGVPTVNPEIGGVYLGVEAESAYVEACVEGLRSIMIELGMLDEAPRPLKRQLLYTVKSRFESNPSLGGYLKSFYGLPSDLGRRVSKGEKLAEVIDLHSFEVIEELTAAVDGYLFFSRYSGVVDAGTKAFAIAEESTSQWL
ncbi:succinylglutamate desuccinylase/aspartoacylase family protein [Microvirga massiliensis]|uniref:succinylglutamate desuccinylase/aspartoacylase family protein n=1 Tax=Microvirga massiliensis TaxID=1033741 RepID=UPI00062B3014|nr:succinylglutamate desuccinylase/aspartoacylase family protein [Microvirga massiliensis]